MQGGVLFIFFSHDGINIKSIGPKASERSDCYRKAHSFLTAKYEASNKTAVIPFQLLLLMRLMKEYFRVYS